MLLCDCQTSQTSILSGKYIELDNQSKLTLDEIGVKYDRPYVRHNEDIGYVPERQRFELNSETINKGIGYFNKAIPLLKGILKARTTGVAPLAGEKVYNVSSRWLYNYETYEYRKGGTTVGPRQTPRYANDFIDNHISTLHFTTEKLLAGRMTFANWYELAGEIISFGHIAMLLFGMGGQNTLTQDNVDGLDGTVQEQLDYFQNFATDIISDPDYYAEPTSPYIPQPIPQPTLRHTPGSGSGKNTPKNILNRIQQYGESATTSFEVGSATARGLILPEYPADGSQDCRANCRCHWDIDEDSDPDYFLCYWTLDPVAKHCNSCIENSRKWNPLRIRKPTEEEEPDPEAGGAGVIPKVLEKTSAIGQSISELVQSNPILVPAIAGLAIGLIGGGILFAKNAGFRTATINQFFRLRQRWKRADPEQGPDLDDLSFWFGENSLGIRLSQQLMARINRFIQDFTDEPDVVPFAPGTGPFRPPQAQPGRLVALTPDDRDYFQQRSDRIQALINLLRQVIRDRDPDTRNLEDNADNSQFVIKEIEKEIDLTAQGFIYFFKRIEEQGEEE